MSGAVATAKPLDGSYMMDEDDKMQVEPVFVESNEQEDLYTRLKTLQRQLEFLHIQVCCSLC